jgi:putative glutamine amidotransferase
VDCEKSRAAVASEAWVSGLSKFFPFSSGFSRSGLAIIFTSFFRAEEAKVGFASTHHQGKESYMFSANSDLRIAIYGSEIKSKGRGVGLWSAGYKSTLIAAGAAPTFLKPASGDESWSELLHGFQGVVVCGFDHGTPGKMGDIESLCLWCREHRFPLLAIDQGLLAMNSAFGGLNFTDLSREMPEALQHRHPPEPGLRHAINVLPGTRMCKIYGEGEIVVNSEHRQAIQRIANGFAATGIALDGVIEAIEYKDDSWFAVGVQWQPASPTASGLDIQVFRALVDAAKPIPTANQSTPRPLAMAG